MRLRRAALFSALLPLVFQVSAPAQQATPMPRDYAGPQTRIPGIFVTPVPGAPFSAKVDIISQQNLPDGTVNIRTTTNHIARASSGAIYNERRQLVSTAFRGEPILLSAHIYDPSNRRSVYLNPFTHVAVATTLQQPPTPPANTVPAVQPVNSNQPVNRMYKEETLGTQSIGSVALQGTRKSRIIPAAQSGTGQEVTIVDEYWYSPDLSIYLIIKHIDPRSGEQIVAVSEIERTEPATTLFTVPANYKQVDETPGPRIDAQ